jgi:hypothetical protein
VGVLVGVGFFAFHGARERARARARSYHLGPPRLSLPY